MPSIADAIQQPKFESPQQRVLLNLLYTASKVKAASAKVLKPLGLTSQQFNILRILQGQRGKPATVRLLSERMLDPQSNASRLVEKLVSKGLVARAMCHEDRRQLRVSLTEAGVERLRAASAAIEQAHASLGASMSPAELEALSEQLDQFREGVRHG